MTAHTDVGAYSMGLLEEQDRREFEDHLAGCPACAAEVAELSPMAALLRGVELREVEPAGAEGDRAHSGWQSQSPWAPSRLTRSTERAAVENNQLSVVNGASAQP